MRSRTVTFGVSLATASMLGSLLAPGMAYAGAKGRKNTAIGLGAVAVQQLLTGKTTNGVLLGAGAAYAYKRYQDAQRDEKRRNRSASVRTNTYRPRTGGSSVGRTTRTTTRTRYGAASPTGRTYSESKGTYVPNGSYYFTGHVINDATELTNRYITVDQNGVARRVSVPKSATVVQAGHTMSVHELQKGDLVRVLAVRGTDHWTASKVELLNAVGADEALRNRDTFGDTYTRRGGTSTTSSRYNGTGVVERVSDDGQSFDLRVGSNVRTVFVDGASFHGLGGAIDLREGDRVRVSGDLDGRDVSAVDVTLVE